MKVRWQILMAVLVTGAAGAWGETTVDLATIKSAYEKQRDGIVGEYGGKIAKAGDEYVKQLEALQKEFKGTGDVAGAAAVTAEIERFQKDRRIIEQASEATLLAVRSAQKSLKKTPLRTVPAQAPAEVRPVEPRPVEVVAKPASTNAVPVRKIPVEKGQVRHAAVGARVTASSTHAGEPGEGPAEALVDGNLFTRWSSDYTTPQQVSIQLEKPVKLEKLRLHWERASATKYCVFLSNDGSNWRSVYLYMNDLKGQAEPEERIDEIALNGASATAVKLDLQQCVSTNWGFSLYEIEIDRVEP